MVYIYMFVSYLLCPNSFSLIVLIAMLCCAVLSHCHVWLFATPWTIARQAPLSVGILQARILEWSPCPSPGTHFYSVCIIYKYECGLIWYQSCLLLYAPVARRVSGLYRWVWIKTERTSEHQSNRPPPLPPWSDSPSAPILASSSLWSPRLMCSLPITHHVFIASGEGNSQSRQLGSLLWVHLREMEVCAQFLSTPNLSPGSYSSHLFTQFYFPRMSSHLCLSQGACTSTKIK